MSGSIFFQVVILDNQDPLMLGRVRATLIIDNYQDIVKGIEDWNEERDKWTVRDPFVFNPLMPYFMYQVPKVGEMAQIIYSNSDFKYQNQYYIQNTFSTPTSTNFEYYVGGNKFTGTGTQYTNPKPLKKGTKKKGETKTITETEEVIVSIKYLIEWTIINPENTQDKFSGQVYLYQLKPDLSTNSKNLTIGSVIQENLKKVVTIQSFELLSKSEVIVFINDFIKSCNSSTTLKNGTQLFSSELNKFPIFYRPNNLTDSILNPSTNNNVSGLAVTNVSDIFSQVKLFPALKQGGYGLIYAKNKVGKPLNFKSTKVTSDTFSNGQLTYGALGGDKLFLLSQSSAIPGKQKINFADTLYGISEEKFVDNIIPNTSSLVRGEELLELVNLIVRFLITHTHAFPGLPPVPISQDGSTVTEILAEMQNATTKILNENIRLN
jgi:hypothetical protein